MFKFELRSFRVSHIAILVSALLSQPSAVAQPAKPTPAEEKAVKDTNGFFVHQLESPYQSGKLPVRVLVPDRFEKGKQYPAVYVLPVEAKDDAKFGDGLLEIQKHDLHNTFQVVFVAPSFSTMPWYANHPTNPELRQESHLLKAVVPLIEKSYPVRAERDGRLLLGFSKSGAGAYSLILRNPDRFGKALAFDSPLMRETLSKGSEVFATQENFEKYCVPKLLEKHAKTFADEKRLILLGKGFLQGQHQQAHALMDKLKIAHEFREGTQRKHTWDSGWIPEAVELLLPTLPKTEVLRVAWLAPSTSKRTGMVKGRGRSRGGAVKGRGGQGDTQLCTEAIELAAQFRRFGRASLLFGLDIG